jgi:thiamine biosynthesis lipoprotein
MVSPVLNGIVSCLSLGALFAQAAAPAPAPAGGPKVVARTFPVMGTEVTFSAYTAEPEKAEHAFAAAYDEIRRVEKLMTDWERPGEPASDIVKINKVAGKKAVKVDPETIEVIEKSLEMSRRSEGAFDITFAAMHGLWKFDEDMDHTIPTPEEIEKRRNLINWRDVIVSTKAGTVKLRRPGMRIGLGGIAKGYAVDRCSAVLRSAGLKDFMVQAGGDLYVSGRKGSVNWMVGVRDPRGGPRDIIARMPIEDHAFSTAGDYERGFVQGGRRYHHIIDPKTGYPSTASREVTIFAPNAFLADALDDAVFILGPGKGMALVDSYPDCATLIVDAHNKVWISKSLEGKLQRTAAPTDGI